MLLIVLCDNLTDFRKGKINARYVVMSRSHSQRPRSFWLAPRIETSAYVQFSEHAQTNRFALSASHICHT